MGHARACVAAGFVALALPSLAAAELTQVPSAHTVITLGSDGVLDVLETATVEADEPSEATWQVTMQRGELFAKPSLVVDGRRYRAGDGKQEIGQARQSGRPPDIVAQLYSARRDHEQPSRVLRHHTAAMRPDSRGHIPDLHHLPD